MDIPSLIVRNVIPFPDGELPQLINGTIYVPAFNGTLINLNDCTVATCSLAYGELYCIPELAGNLAYLIIFAIFLALQTGLGIYYRTWGVMVGMVCGMILEILGYVGRIGLHDNDFSFTWFVIYLVCLTLGPAFMSAAIYLCLSRLVVAYSPQIARFSPITYTITFICCDIISLALQATGGGLAASATFGSQEYQAGVDILIAGLSFQVASLALFVVLGLDFVIAARRARHNELNTNFDVLRSKPLFRLFPYGLTIAIIFILIRCCFRVAELSDGFSGSIANNQTLFMVFEGPMIMVASLALTILHPGVCFGSKESWKAANWDRKTNHRTPNAVLPTGEGQKDIASSYTS